jgi:pantoate--beta-alanine ligase
VSKLFHLVNPHFAYFGEKDLQQLKIIETLVRDLSMKVNIVPCPTLREEGGLAMSSRNLRLNEEQRARALDVIAYLQKAKSLLGSIPHEQIEEQLANDILQKNRLKLEYLRIVDEKTLQKTNNPMSSSNVAICMAAWVDEIRLIDNIIVRS